MTLPASGPLALTDIQTEFGGTNPIGINEYYAGGGLVPAGTTGTYGAVPSSGALSVQNFYGTTAFVPTYIEDVFSTYLYKGNDSTQTINSGVDLADKGGVAWVKARNAGFDNCLSMTGLPGNNYLQTNTENPVLADAIFTGFTSTGFGITAAGGAVTNSADYNYVGWSIARQPKFFDVVTFVGNNTANQAVPHNLGSVPGFIVIRKISGSGMWPTYHRNLGRNYFQRLNSPIAGQTVANIWGTTDPTSTNFYVSNVTNPGTALPFVEPGQTYIAMVFAHDAGGFGDDGLQNVISCGSFTSDGSGNATVNLGFEPQWLMTKSTNTTGNWVMVDVMRGWAQENNQNILKANSIDIESANSANLTNITSTGIKSYLTYLGANNTYIYIAIRRPMKTPESGTEVYNAVTYTGNATARSITAVGFPTDLTIIKDTSNGALASSPGFYDRLRGATKRIYSSGADLESSVAQSVTGFDLMDGIRIGTDSNINFNAETFVAWNLRRAPGFFDVVAYTGTGVARTVAHNLGVAPGLMIVKSRSDTRDWRVYYGDNTKSLVLQTTAAAATNSGYWNNTSPTASVFTVGTDVDTNYSNFTYVAYLFATLAGVSKIGSYTGTAALQTINCGFSAGARFVLIKRVDAASSAWYVWDTARGIVAGNDPYLLLNSSAAQVTGTDYIDPASTGFQISSTAPAAINASGGTFIFLAIA